MNSVTYMDPVLYKAAEEGNIQPFENSETPLSQYLLTSNDDTILHVYLRNQSGEKKVFFFFNDYRTSKMRGFVARILGMCPQLLLQANKKGETPLHLAARYGQSHVVKVLIKHAKALPTDPESRVTGAEKMLRMTNKELDTALHEAARTVHSDVVKILFKEDPEFSYSANVRGETPLYIAVSSNGKRQKRRPVIDEILKNCISVDYGGPNGITALHAAIKKGDEVTARQLIEKEKNLTKTTDHNGWSPLHYAAYFFDDNLLVRVLLEDDASAVCNIADKEKKRTALHIAAIRGHIEVMEKIVDRCPACCEQVDNRGWNVLHYAVASKRTDVVRKCLEIPELARLKTRKDDEGNTPFHLVAVLALKDERWKNVLISDSDGESLRYDVNKQNLSAYDIYSENLTERQKKEILESLEDVGSGSLGRERIDLKEEDKNNEDALDKATESQLVVGALIATVTFAAAFTLPGGYKNEEGPNQGTAVLSKEINFVVFIITDAISMVLSLFAVFIHLWKPVIRSLTVEKHYKVIIRSAHYFICYAMTSMVSAFSNGLLAVLAPSPWLAISTVIILSSFFVLTSSFHKHYIKRSMLDLIQG